VLTGKAINGKETIAFDMQRLMSQLTNKTVKLTDLYYMIPRTDKMLPAELKKKNAFDWMLELVQKLLLKMPMEAFKPGEQLESRKKILWSA
jgi:tRNA uridine 5-carbamoylmethylation protein Kti12